MVAGNTLFRLDEQMNLIWPDQTNQSVKLFVEKLRLICKVVL
jgi:hypothetical protein